jgi:hypothetical protein
MYMLDHYLGFGFLDLFAGVIDGLVSLGQVRLRAARSCPWPASLPA